MTERRGNRISTSNVIICHCCSNPNAVMSIVYDETRLWDGVEHKVSIREELCDSCFVNYYPILTKDQEPQPF